MLITLLSILTGLNVSLAATEVLSLDQYLNQVKAKGTNYLAAFSTSQGALKRSNESDLLISPTLFSNIQIGTDRSPRNNPSFEGTRADQQSFELGVSQVTTFGLSGRIYYSLSNTTIYGASSSFLPQPSYYLGRPTLELSQPLIRNGLGSETQALIEASRAQALMTHHLEDYRARMSLVQAEMSYWRLTAAREILAIQNENLERAKKLREWNTGRAKLRLADHSDVLQAEANYRFRLMEQHSAMDEERSASESFNSLRGLSSKSVQESLVKLGDAASLRSDHLIELKKEIIRSDAQSIVEGFKLADASAKMGYEKNLPTLDLVGSVSLNGRSETLSPAVSESLKTQQNIAGVQLKFS
ncbi:MAG: TolC family protein, partial [Bdellovibrionota bacterium]